ncbi:MAG: TIGR03905 family TSCPD domain-containing protein [Clostridia bacterium]|nr:TIGR03905 family TSCPD domain-containing protein [Clostridia bacterium]
MHYDFTPMGVCSMRISFDIENDTVHNVKFLGGCAGNTQGVARLCEGRNAEELVEILEGIRCGGKGTSCPDQLAGAIRQALEE